DQRAGHGAQSRDRQTPHRQRHRLHVHERLLGKPRRDQAVGDFAGRVSRMGSGSGTQMTDFNVSPFVVIWENTRACDLACRHCRAAAQPRRSQFELTKEEGFRLIYEVAEMKPKVFVITGGDPLKREDTYDMISYAKMRGLEPSLT